MNYSRLSRYMSIRLSSPSNKRGTLTSTLLRSISVFVYTHMSRIARTLTSTPLRLGVRLTHIKSKRDSESHASMVPESLSAFAFVLFVHICEFCGLICGDAGVDNLLNIAVHDLV